MGQLTDAQKKLAQVVSSELKLGESQVINTLELILSDCTVPFIARYRKEKTGNLDEVQIRDVRDRFEYLSQLEERKHAVLRSIEEQGKLTPELKKRIEACQTKTLLEDLYLPFKPRKRTRGQMARERGLEPHANRLLGREGALVQDLPTFFQEMVGKHEDLKTPEDVKNGCKDLIAETVSEIAELRQSLRDWVYQNAQYRAVVRDEFKDKKTKYNQYYEFREAVKDIAPHRLMALRRAEKEDIIRVSVEYDTLPPVQLVERHTLPNGAMGDLKAFLEECAKDAFDRLLSTAVETEIRLDSKSSAEEDAIRVFSKNLRHLLLLPPIPSATVLGVDPGIRTGSKLVVVDPTGKLLETATINPLLSAKPDHPKNVEALGRLEQLLSRHKVDFISVGNGTGSREVCDLISHMLETKGLGKNLKLVVVNESGASVYSASDVAREEFPELDVTLRGAVSIARRLQDPLAELVKIDPKSIGVGQYQHDVNQSKLRKSLGEVVESSVNYVGVNLNTASASLLSYVAGIGPNLAKTIVREREAKGVYSSRASLLNVHGFGPKAFEQCAGFLRIPESENPLDNTAVHPESYPVVKKIAQKAGKTLKELLGNRSVLDSVALDDLVSEGVGLLTLKDIIAELKKPGRDPREEGASRKYTNDVRKLEELKEGQILDGTVTNVTNFGAFVDIGVHQDGLVHVSELSNDFVKDAAEVISVGTRVKVKVIGVDLERKRISLSCKAVAEGPGVSRSSPAAEKSSSSERPKGGGKHHGARTRPGAEAGPRRGASRTSSSPEQLSPRRERSRQEPDKPASLDDLMAKFKSHKV